jgi:hypothetical protein
MAVKARNLPTLTPSGTSNGAQSEQSSCQTDSMLRGALGCVASDSAISQGRPGGNNSTVVTTGVKAQLTSETAKANDHVRSGVTVSATHNQANDHVRPSATVTTPAFQNKRSDP